MEIRTRMNRMVRWGRLGGILLALLALMLTALPVTPAVHAASGDCSSSGTTVTCTFDYTGAAQTFTVPADVTTLHVVAHGAQGADFLSAPMQKVD